MKRQTSETATLKIGSEDFFKYCVFFVIMQIFCAGMILRMLLGSMAQ